MQIKSPLAIQDGERPSDPKSIEFLVHTILGNSEVAGYIPNIVESITAHYDSIDNLDVVLSLIQQYFLNLISNTQSLAPEYLEALKLVSLHMRETDQNRKAYSVHDKLNMNAVFWPDPTLSNGARSIYDEIPYAETFGFIDETTPIGSAGSCFAMEIAHRFQRAGYNYVIEERRRAFPDEEPPKLVMASAAWGIVFNIPGLRQIVDKAFGIRIVPKLLWKNSYKGKIVYSDPFREDVNYVSLDQYEEEYAAHIEACRRVFLKCKVFIMTFGLNEVWFLKSDGTVFARCPHQFSALLTERRILTVEENLNHLQHIYEVLKTHNPELKLIVSVSPVPFHATFRASTTHAITANCHSKAVLRVAAEEFAKKNEDVFYLPSFESVMYCTKSPWDADQRHVSRQAVDGVMKLFSKMFLIQGDTDVLYNPAIHARHT